MLLASEDISSCWFITVKAVSGLVNLHQSCNLVYASFLVSTAESVLSSLFLEIEILG